MNTFDIIFAIILCVALWQGYKRGLIVELCGIIGVILGVFVAYNFSDFIFSKLDISSSMPKVVGYVLIVIAVLIVVGIAARAISKLLDFTGLGIINKALGAVASVAKYVIITSMFLMVFNSMNKKYEWVERSMIEASTIYEPMLTVSDTIFPYLTDFKLFIGDNINFLQDKIEEPLETIKKLAPNNI